MVDSCFKIFRAKCFRKSSLKSLRDSRQSFYEIDKNAINDDISSDKKLNFDTNSTSIDNVKKAKPDNIINELEPLQALDEIDPNVTLRHPNRLYLRSISTSISNDVLSSEDEDDENLDVLYPLPHANNHDYSPIEETIRQIFDDKNNGTEIGFIFTSS